MIFMKSHPRFSWNIILYFFRKLGKMSQNLSSAAVAIVSLRVNHRTINAMLVHLSTIICIRLEILKVYPCRKKTCLQGLRPVHNLMPNGICHRYQLEQSKSVFKGCWVFLLNILFFQNLKITFSKQTVETLIRRRVLRRLVWVRSVCLCPTNRMLGL